MRSALAMVPPTGTRNCTTMREEATEYRLGVPYQRRDGRYVLRLRDHPSASRSGTILRARVVMEQKIGRRLRPGEVVHHIDGDPANDDPENLALMTHVDHARMHATISQWARAAHCCVECGTTEAPHHANRRCQKCDKRARRRGSAPC